MEVRKEIITPEMAVKMLEANKGNRPISDVTVKQYASDMLAGRWRTSGNTISPAPSGNLLNGQHRLWAIVESGKPQEFILVTEDEEDLIGIYDIGRGRTGSAILKMAGVRNNAVAHGIAGKYLMYRKSLNLDLPKNAPDELKWPLTKPWLATMITKTEPINYAIEHNEELQKFMVYSEQFQKEFRSGKVWYASVAYILSHTSKHPCERWGDEFHEGVITGSNLTEGDPRLALRRYVTRNPSAQTLWENQERIAIGIIAWNRWLTGKDSKLLRFGKSGLPMPVGE